ncbi:MAG: hypothetical protein KC502_03150 [Myxococcales bacterium]|nr:hypothetical protein [Myxococcales bacterium]
MNDRSISLHPLLAVCALAFVPVLTVPANAAAASVRTLVVPTAAHGDVRAIYLKRIDRGLQRTLAFSAHLKVTNDADRPAQKGKAGAVGARKATKLEKQIEKADKLRSAGMEYQTKDPFKALALFRKATKLYEGAAPELVDFTKLADAYTRAGLMTFANRGGRKNVQGWFMKGLALQPTLVINRRSQPAKLLKLFDQTVKRMTGLKKVGVKVIGDAPGATCYIDGIKSGPLPATNNKLIRGAHFIQVRGPGIKPWGKVVFIGRPNFTVKAKPKKLKVKAKKQSVILSFSDLGNCPKKGLFAKRKCNKQVKHLLRQTDSDFALFTLAKADRYGRLTLHGFLIKPHKKRKRPALVVSLKSVAMKKNLSDLNARLTDFAAIVAKATADFPKARALRKVPRAFSD